MEIIRPEYADKPASFQRTMDWLFRSESGMKLWAQKIAKEKRRNEEIMRENAREEQAETRKTVEGLGQMRGIIPVSVYMRWEQDKPGCWKDPAFLREFYRDNPQCRAVKPVSNTIVVSGFRK